LFHHAVYINLVFRAFSFAKLMETPQSAKESGHTNAKNMKKMGRKEPPLPFLGPKNLQARCAISYICTQTTRCEVRCNPPIKAAISRMKQAQQTVAQRVAT